MQYTTFESIPESQFEEWKKKHPIYLVEVDINDDEIDGPKAKFVLRTLSMSQQNALGEFVRKKGTALSEVQKTLFKSVVVGGDMQYIDFEAEDSRFITVVLQQYEQIMEKKKATLKRL
jgi:hypothetical protein